MLFLLIRIFPVLIPVGYFFILKFLFAFSGAWYWFLILAAALNLFYFILLNWKLGRKRVWFFALYSEIFVVLGLVNALLLSNQIFINLFIIIWSIIYLIYLESVFNYLYRTTRFSLIDLKSIAGYISLLMCFIISYALLNFYVFLNFPWWALIIIYFPVIFILFFERFLAYDFPFKTNFLYSFLTALVLIEILIVLLWWPNSIYVLALILLIFYYLLSSIAILYWQDKLTKKSARQYLVFAAVVLVLVLMTASWR
ncbi:MAG: hypothetical protein WC610_02915 [Patescibacteria group bacterium]